MTISRTNPLWWTRGIAMERGLTLIMIFGTILCFVPGQCRKGIIVHNSNYNFNFGGEVTTPPPIEARTRKLPSVQRSQHNSPSHKTCTSAACAYAALHITENLNISVAPCDDFYRFVCGRYIKTTIIPDDKDTVNAFTLINDHVKGQIKSSLEQPITLDDPKAIKLAKNLYKYCMNIQDIEQLGVTPLLQTLKHLGGWPVLEGDKWNESDFSYLESTCRSRNIGHSTGFFFHFGITSDAKNTTRRLIALDQAKLGLSREYLVEGKNDEILIAYREFMVDIAVLLGASPKVAEEELTESLEFERALAAISFAKDQRRNATLLHNPMTLTELANRYVSIPWKAYFNRLLGPNMSVHDDEIVNVVVPKYLSDFEILVNMTSKRVQANYFMWRIALDSMSYLNEACRQREFEFTMRIDGSVKREERWRECTGVVAMSLPLSVGALFIRTYFNKDAKRDAVEMVENIKNAFKDILKKIDWMDENTRRSALDKATVMSSHIAYPDELLDDKKLEEFYGTLELDGGSYLKSMLELSLFSANYMFSELRTPVNKTDWKRHGRAAVVNAYYGPSENSIQFPAGILQGIFFDQDRPKYMNYGAIGFVIGHEITHGFDDQGRQFDKDGNILDWWAPSTAEKYLYKSQCIIDQYSNYIEPDVELRLNGVNTQGENIADNGGIKAAYMAYQKWAKRNGEEPRLPDLNFTAQQLFWISAASTWCTKYRPESLKYHITTDFHSPSEFRILGPFSNMIDFARDFKCPEGSRMNPQKKCAVW